MSVMAAGAMETTALGQKVMGWTVQSDDVETDGTKTSSQMLFSPQLGQPIQEDDSQSASSGGSKMEIKMTLVSDHLE